MHMPPEGQDGDADGGGGAPRPHEQLKPRHIAMIALGGVIGAGLFVGSGAGVREAGPSIILAYVLGGLLVLLVMRMMGEMSAANPVRGSFSVHAENAIGPWAGFTAGWMYWSMLVVGVAVEAIGAGTILNGWLPAVPSWVFILVIMALFSGVNMVAVGSFGEFEFWFAALKVGAVVLFLIIGVLAIAGLLPGTPAPGLDNLLRHGGFFPNGLPGLVAGLLGAVFAFAGLEVVTIAAADSGDPAGSVGRAVRTAVYRIGLFYIGSMIVIVTLLPWDASQVGKSPYVAVLQYIGVPAAAQIMNVVVLVALLSAINANLYGSSRMLHSLVDRGEAPRALGRTWHGGVPRYAVACSAAFGFASVVLNVIWPDTVFQFLVNATGGIVLMVWGLVTVSELRLRPRYEREGRLVLRMWCFPVLSWCALAALALVYALMLGDSATRSQGVTTTILAVVVVTAGLLRARARTRAGTGG
ncbi:amino acid transporter [Mangrovactinospora gilvigrisea]|uniref:Amino acid transporter n=1 Tax=Mangrovactinospora gilvigrisea TaxID=1428644 RepID=A0A1J7CAB4_9ACTN|nr:amino acid permease [Mangrovactinospora gilvigrisea]OIV36594.1 amino acid transporter [Mangrovactinospora gilvigrisea]